MPEPSGEVTKRDCVRWASILALTLVIIWHRPGPSWFWVCHNPPCGAMTLFGPLLSTLASVLVFGVIYRYV